MQTLQEFTHWLWRPARLLLRVGLIAAELLITGALGLWLFAGYLTEVSVSISLARDLFTCALHVLFSAGITSMLMQAVYWKDIRE